MNGFVHFHRKFISIEITYDLYRFLFEFILQSTVDLIATVIAAAACGYTFWKIQLVAGYIFIPYLAWLCFATYLNVSIYLLNQSKPKIIPTTATTGTV